MPLDPTPGPSGLPLLAGTCHHLYSSHVTDFLPQSLPRTQRQVGQLGQAADVWGTMLQGAPFPAFASVSRCFFILFYLKGICICEWECVPLSGDLSGRLYINTPGLGAGIGRAGDAAVGRGDGEQWRWKSRIQVSEGKKVEARTSAGQRPWLLSKCKVVSCQGPDLGGQFSVELQCEQQCG